MADFELKGKTILITGGSSGIGKMTAVLCAEQGAHVIILGTNKERLDQVLRSLKGTGHRRVVCDLTEHRDYGFLFDEIVERAGRLDGLVHCAGINGGYPLRAIKREHLTQVMGVHFYAFVELVKQYAKKKNSHGGSIVAVSSAAADIGEVCQTVYSAAKGAVDAAVRCMAVELIPKGIRVNAVKPGMIKTEMMDRVLERGSKAESLGAASRLGVGEPQDVANAVLFLLSDRSKHISGREILVDGCAL